jgi:hypothetical protein
MQRNPVIIHPPQESEPPSPIEQRDIRQTYGLITAIDTNSLERSLLLLEIPSSRTQNFEILDSTHIRNRFGATLALNELNVGMIIDIGYEQNSMSLASVSESAQAWEMRFQNNVRIDLENATISLGNESYNYNSQTIVHYRGESYPISQITPMDTVTLVGYHNNVWFIRLEGSHGFVRFEQSDKIIDGTLAIDTSIFMLLKDATESIPLVEGTHRIVIEGQNIETYIRDILISPGETNTVSLIDVELRLARLLITVSEPDAIIIINGEVQEEPGPVEVEFGEHQVRIEKEGFLPVEQTITVNQAQREFAIELTRIPTTARVMVYTSPSPAEIFIDNVFVGYSPLTREMETGTITVTARLEGYNDFTLASWVLEDGDNARTLLLTERTPDPFANMPPPQETQPLDPVATPPPLDNTPPWDTSPWDTSPWDTSPWDAPPPYEPPTYDPPPEYVNDPWNFYIP